MEASASKDSGISGYHNGIREANRVMRRMVDAIMAASNRRAVILVMGDHGYRLFGKSHPGRQFRNFCALYFPTAITGPCRMI